jgi:hypothetical protein
MVLQKIRETGQSIKFNVWLDGAVPLPNRRFNLLVDKFDYVLNMWLKIFVISAHRQPTEGNKALTSVFTFSFIDVFFNLIDNLSESTLLLVVARDKPVH